jgi:hypothetical protein
MYNSNECESKKYIFGVDHMTAQRNQFCPLCGGDNECSLALTGNLAEQCWCKNILIEKSIIEQIPVKEINNTCICARCSSKETSTAAVSQPTEPS